MSGSSSPIDDYLARLERRLATDAPTRAQILAELRSHIEESTAHEQERGANRADAEAQVVAGFGGASEVAAGLNAVHPAGWDALRFLRGAAWGVVASWFLWTAVTYPLLVYLTLQQAHLPGNPPGIAADPALDLLFYATPLAFGAFWVLATSPLLWLVPFLLLYAAIPFAWGRRSRLGSRLGWRPGLAYGLGVVVGFPWMLPAVVAQWAEQGPRQALAVLLTALVIWLLVPFAMLASWLGSRVPFHLPFARRRSSAAVGRAAGSQGSLVRSRRLSLILPRALTVAAALALVAVAIWSWNAVEMWAARPQPTVVEQLAAAQGRVGFAIRRPTTLPDGVQLSSIVPPLADCSPCSVSLVFQGTQGEKLWLDESDYIPTGLALPTPPNYQVSQGAVGSYHPVWWLFARRTTEHQVNLVWQAGGIAYFLGSDGAFSLDELKQVAASIPTGPSAS